MEFYNSEEEQLEALKRWWKTNGSAVIAGVIFGIILILGWNFWQNHKENRSLEASEIYQGMLDATQGDKPEEARKFSQQLLEDYSDTSYAQYAALYEAKYQVEKGNFEAAVDALEQAASLAQTDAMENLIELRMIEITVAQGELEDALDDIDDLDITANHPFSAPYFELKGDILVALDRKDEALGAYQAAQRAGASSRFLQLKMDEIAVP